MSRIFLAACDLVCLRVARLATLVVGVVGTGIALVMAASDL
jgi:hypothetical protein